MNQSTEFMELYELNVELLETLLLVGQQLLDYAQKHSIPLEGKQRLIFLIGSARKIMEEIAQPYRGNPIIKRDVTKSKQNQGSLQKMEPMNPYPPSAVQRFSGAARIRFS
jgi:hypothetical protein